MEIPSNLILHNFRRYDMGTQGAAFVRYAATEADDRKAEVIENMMQYFGGEYVSYIVKVPVPRTRNVTGIVIIERTSKSRYGVAAWGNGKVTMFSASNTKEIIDELAWLWRETR